jgi:hypothetical protein
LGFEVLGLLVVGMAEERMRCSGGRRVAFDLVESHRVWLNWKSGSAKQEWKQGSGDVVKKFTTNNATL